MPGLGAVILSWHCLRPVSEGRYTHHAFAPPETLLPGVDFRLFLERSLTFAVMRPSRRAGASLRRAASPTAPGLSGEGRRVRARVDPDRGDATADLPFVPHPVLGFQAVTEKQAASRCAKSGFSAWLRSKNAHKTMPISEAFALVNGECGVDGNEMYVCCYGPRIRRAVNVK